SSFFNSENGDRKYKAEDWDRHLKDLIGNGVFLQDSNNLQVTADGSGMSVVVQPGSAWINGKHYYNDQALTLAIGIADGQLNRVDRVILQLNTSGRVINAKIKAGTPASSAVAPDLQRDADAYELSLATVAINAGAIAISQANVTDTRLDTSVCGAVTGLVKQVGTDTLYAQIQDDLQHFRQDSESGFTSWSTEQKTEFDAWFQSIKDILDSDTAGHLQNEIDAHIAEVNADVTTSIPAGTATQVQPLRDTDSNPTVELKGQSTQNGTPTPDAPVPIVSVESPVNVYVAHKNLADMAFNVTWGTAHVVMASGLVTITGGGAADWSTYWGTPVYLKAGTKITISTKYHSGARTAGTNYIFGLRLKATDGTLILLGDYHTSHADSDGVSSHTYTLPQDGIAVGIYPYISGGDSTNAITWSLQLEIGDTATAWEAPNISTVSIPLTAADTTAYPDPLELRATDANHSDKIALDTDGRWKIFRYTEFYIFDNTFSSGYYSNKYLTSGIYDLPVLSRHVRSGARIGYFTLGGYYPETWNGMPRITLDAEKTNALLNIPSDTTTAVSGYIIPWLKQSNAQALFPSDLHCAPSPKCWKIIDLSSDTQTALTNLRTAIAPLASSTALTVTSDAPMDIISRGKFHQQQDDIDTRISYDSDKKLPDSCIPDNVITFNKAGTNFITSTTLPIKQTWVSLAAKTEDNNSAGFFALPLNSQNAAFSKDGEAWGTVILPISNNWVKVINIPDCFFILSQTGAYKYDVDSGVTTLTMPTLPDGAVFYDCVCIGNRILVSTSYVSTDVQSKLIYSDDSGNTWSSFADSPIDAKYSPQLFAANSKFFIIPFQDDDFFSGFNTNTIYQSDDGITWENIILPESTAWRAITYGNGVYVIVAEDTADCYYSSNLEFWAKTTLADGYDGRYLIFADGLFIATDESSSMTSHYCYSHDGKSWKSSTFAAKNFTHQMAYFNEKWIGLGVTNYRIDNDYTKTELANISEKSLSQNVFSYYIVTGMYTGNGNATGQAIILGFRPRAVIIHSQKDVYYGSTTSQIYGSGMALDGLPAGTIGSTSGGIEITNDGFTVYGNGSYYYPNSSGQIRYYIALR
ncbi:MAG: hypothetical protein PHE09_19365, partial [Oscillospiraceae bacterium]|nr:hypothetical protein [Oscillospiraceae bacterium]